MSVPELFIGALVVAALYLGGRRYGTWVLETVMHGVLVTVNPGILRGSAAVTGPKWQYPNGLVLHRFVDGRGSSEAWRKYGAVYRVWAGPHPEIVITTPADFRHFAADANDHGKPHHMNLGWFLGQALGQCLGFQIGDDWVRMRKVFDPTFTHRAAVAQVDTIDDVAREHVANLPQQAVRSDDRSFVVPAVTALQKYPYFLTARVIYGPMTATEQDELWALTEQRAALNPEFLSGGRYRFATTTKLFDPKALQRFRAYETAWRAYNTRLVAVRRERGDRAPILEYWAEYERGTMTLPELLQTLDELLMLNLDVIAHALTWYVTLIADHAPVKAELCAEIAAHDTEILQYLTKTDTHLHRCFIESMRIRPFAIFTPGEYSNQPKNFHGVLVKPGTQILLDVLAINVRNPFWGPNSEAFEPSRLKDIKPADLRYNLHSFGIGSRKCMGQYVASHIVKALVLHLFKEYDVTLSKEVQQKGAYDIDQTSWTPKAGEQLRLTKRPVAA